MWAPNAQTVTLALDDEQHTLEPEADGCSRSRSPPARVRATRTPSTTARRCPTRARVRSPTASAAVGGRRSGAFEWTDDEWAGVADRRPGDLRAPRRHVHRRGHLRRRDRAAARARDLGVTAVELMPVATFPGEPRLGLRRRLHVGAAPAPTAGPTGSRASSTPRTRAGLAVILDVVYNHVGPGSEALAAFGPYFTDRYDDLLGRRDRLLAALRCASGRSRTPSTGCATTASTACASTRRTRSSTTRAPHVAGRARRARAGARPRDARDLGDGDRRPAPARGVGPRRAVGRRAPPRGARPRHRRARRLLRRTTARSPTSRASSSARRAERFVVCAQNHDQVGNRAFGDRLPPASGCASPPSARCSLPASRCCSWARSTARRQPFQFFTDHIDPGDRPGDARGPAAGVRDVRGVRGRGRARSAEPRDLSPLEARPGDGDADHRALLPCACSRCGGELPASRSRR